MESESDRITQRLDVLCDVPVSKVILDIRNFESHHQSKISNDYNRFIRQFEVTFSLITDCVHALNYVEKTTWPKHRGIQFLLYTHNLKTLYSSFDRLIRGSYEDSLSLTRTVYEAFIKIIFLNCFPQSSSALFQKIKDVPNFNLDNFIKDNLKLDWHDHRLLSMMVHSNNYSVLQGWVELAQRPQTEPICLQYQFDKRLFELGVNYTCYLLSVYLKILDDLFISGTNHILTQDTVNLVKEMAELRISSLETHPLDKWPQTMKDTRDIFNMVKRTDAGEPWESAWNGIRKNVNGASLGTS